jgi:eukaryotic-like serine/threonine-protein kinase
VPMAPIAAPTAPLVPATVKLSVVSSPPGASVIRLDSGAVVGVTPFTGQVPRLESDVTFALKLEGYEPAQRSIRLDANSRLDVTLEKVKTAAVTPVRPAKAKKAIGKESTIDPFSE